MERKVNRNGGMEGNRREKVEWKKERKKREGCSFLTE